MAGKPANKQKTGARRSPSSEHPGAFRGTENPKRSDTALLRMGLNVTLLRERLDLSIWDRQPKGWVLAYAYRLCDPGERSALRDIERELHISRTEGWRKRSDPLFKDLMRQFHELMLDTAFIQVFRRTTQQALDGDTTAQRLFYEVTGKTGSRPGPGRSPSSQDFVEISGGIADVDDFRGEKEDYLERIIAEQLDLIRRARLAADEPTVQE